MGANENWKTDLIPEIWNGHTIADLVDVRIMSKIASLESEEHDISRDWQSRLSDQTYKAHLNTKDQAILAHLRIQQGQLLKTHRAKKSLSRNSSVCARTDANHIYPKNSYSNSMQKKQLKAKRHSFELKNSHTYA